MLSGLFSGLVLSGHDTCISHISKVIIFTFDSMDHLKCIARFDHYPNTNIEQELIDPFYR